MKRLYFYLCYATRHLRQGNERIVFTLFCVDVGKSARKMNRGRSIALLFVILVVAFTPITRAVGQVDPESARSSTVREQPSYLLLEQSDIPSPHGVHPVFKVTDANSELAQRAARLLEESYARQALILHQYVKNYLAHQADSDPAITTEPTYLFLGGSGGYADLGFWLEDAQGQLIDKRTVSYVGGLVIVEGYWGGFEPIFSHELGHAMLRELSGWPEGVLAAQIHQVTRITDYVYAFDEGWGEHFQTVAIDHTANANLKAKRDQPLPVGEKAPYARLVRELKGRCLLCPARLSLLLWYDLHEQRMRYSGVKSNLFAHRPEIPEELLQRHDQQDALLYQVVVTPDGSDEFKNGSQMLACEGLTAALFYRLVNDPRLQQTYREPAFYERFLPPGYAVDWMQTSPQELFDPIENVYLKLFHVFAQHVQCGDLPDESPIIQMLHGYAAEYPDEAEAFYDVFLDVTQGVTIEPEALQKAQDWKAGWLTTAEHQAYLEDLHRRLLSGQVEVNAALGPQIWLRNPYTQVGVAVMDVYRSLPRPHHFDLNAATVVDLRTVPGVGVDLARHIVWVRDEQGGFDTLEGLSKVAGVTPEIVDRFRSMRRAMREWLDQGMRNPEKEVDVGTIIWSLLWRLLAGLALVSVVAGLVLVGGSFLQAAGARRLGLEARSMGQELVRYKVRRALGRAGRVLITAVLLIMLFFLAQVFLPASNGGQIFGIAFAIAVWLLTIVPLLGWRVLRRRLDGRFALYRAAWSLMIYVAMFMVIGWLMGV